MSHYFHRAPANSIPLPSPPAPEHLPLRAIPPPRSAVVVGRVAAPALAPALPPPRAAAARAREQGVDVRPGLRARARVSGSRGGLSLSPAVLGASTILLGASTILPGASTMIPVCPARCH